MGEKRWKIDPTHSSLSMVVRHMLVSRVRGQFQRWGGVLELDGASRGGLTSVSVCIDAASIDTQVPMRDAHLRSRDFLDAARHPTIGFRSTSVVPVGPSRTSLSGHDSPARAFQVTGELTLRGVTRAVVLDATYEGRVRDLDGVERIGFSALATISRKAFGITFNHVLDTGGLAIGDKLELCIDLAAVQERAEVLRQPAAGEP